MEPHHAQSIDHLVAAFRQDDTVLALILGGSIAHDFARPDSDIDVTIVVAPADYQRRVRDQRLHYHNRALCTYAQGYIDGKYVDLPFLQLVAQRGSEPARYAYQGNRILFSRIDGLEQLLAAIVRYPRETKRVRMDRFAAQLLAWRWYFSEALRQQSSYLTLLSLQKIALFSCRLVLAENELLFPYHKWMRRLAQSAARQPAGFEADLDVLLTVDGATWDRVDAFCRSMLAFAGIDFATADAVWPTTFMKDTELRWLDAEAPVDDL